MMRYSIKNLIVYTLITANLMLIGCTGMVTQSANTEISYADREYSTVVGQVILSPGLQTGTIQNPVISIAKQNLALSFDLQENDFSYLNLKIFHCNRDWSKSGLNDLEYLKEFNEFPINTYSFSKAIYSAYTSYFISLPPVTKTGNYVAAVYRDNGTLLFTRRFVVFENRAAITPNLVLSNDVYKRRTHHQIDFDIRLSKVNIINPNQDIRVVLLQNHNWNTALISLTPTNARMDQLLFEYRPFDGSNNFPGLNEYRFFDISLLAAKGQQIARTGLMGDKPVAFGEPQTSRAMQAYSEVLIRDLDGRFILSNRNPFEQDDQSEYVLVKLTLKSERLDLPVYVIGRFNNWQLLESNLMKYNDASQEYECTLKLKQGFYNYHFFVLGDEGTKMLEGNHQQTVNQYEILVYYREPGTIFDQVLGYTQF